MDMYQVSMFLYRNAEPEIVMRHKGQTRSNVQRQQVLLQNVCQNQSVHQLENHGTCSNCWKWNANQLQKEGSLKRKASLLKLRFIW